MKRVLSAFLAVLLLISAFPMGVTVNAAGQDDLFFSLNADGESYSVIDCNANATGHLWIPSIYGGKPVTTIGDEAFSGCYYLTDINIPSSVKTIGSYAFFGCSGLSSITVPDSVTTIARGAFSGCSGLQSMTIPFVGGSANATGAASDTLFGHIFGTNSYSGDSSVLQYYYDSYYGSVTYYIPAGLRSVTVTGGKLFYGAFYNCSALTSVSLGNGVESIGENAFYNCAGLTEIYIPEGVVSIADGAFNVCESLSRITVSANNQNFSNDTRGVLFDKAKANLLHVPKMISGAYYIPNTITAVPNNAFSGCDKLTAITIPNTVTSIGSSAFSGCSGLTAMTIPDSVTTIAQGAFSGCSGLQSMTIPFVGGSANATGAASDTLFGHIFGISSYSGDSSVLQYYYDSYYGSVTYHIPAGLRSVTVTGGKLFYGAFYNCNTLTEIKIPNDLVAVGEQAFYNCTGLTGIGIPVSVKTIGQYAFSGCTNLNSIWYMGKRTDRDAMTLNSTTNSSLINATWYYECCFGSATHTFDNCYDTVCNLCGKTRGITHTYEWVIDREETCVAVGIKHEECAICHIKRNENTVIPITAKHQYDHDCDTECNLCGAGRTTQHQYDGDCDATCNVCSAVRTNVDPHTVQLFTISESRSSSYSTTETRTELTMLHDGTVTINCEFSNLYYGDYCEVVHKDSILCYACGPEDDVELRIEAKKGEKITIYTQCSSEVLFHYDLTPAAGLVLPEDVEPFCEEDIPCAGCGEIVKTSVGHAYSGSCDTVCNRCEAVRESEGEHFYTDGYDTECNVCGDICARESGSFTDGYFTFTIYPSEKGGQAELTACSPSVSGQISVPERVRSYPVTVIGPSAFANCQSLTHITLPDGIKSIGSYAFDHCSGLKEFNMPESVEEVGSAILSGCTGLLELELPFLDGKLASLFDVLSYGEISNESVPLSLKIVSVWGGVIEESAFENCDNISIVNLGDGVTEIKPYAFLGCNSITTVSIGNGTETVGYSAFENCISLTNVSIGSGTKTIEDMAFYGCVSLSNLSLGDNIESIKDSAFYNCYSLETVQLPAKLQQLGNYAFYNCEKLKEIAIPDQTTLLGAYAFANCKSLKKATLGERVTTIYDGVFQACSSLQSIILPASATSIGEEVFADCIALQRAVFRGRTDHINNAMFYGCYNLTSVAFPVNVNTIAYNAFSGCSKLKDVWYEGNETQASRITIAYGNDDIREATWHYASFDTVGHVYDNEYDKVCNICGATRAAATRNPFTDVKKKDYYYKAVLWAVGNGVTAGSTPTTFAPKEVCTRGQIVAFLWRAAGSPAPKNSRNPFTDVKKSDYYYKAVLWAVENGITAGSTPTTFAPKEACTRGQIVAFLWRAAGNPKPQSSHNPFTDVKKKDYYYKAVLWAVENGITAGSTPTTFAPKAPCTRGQIAAFLYRYYN